MSSYIQKILLTGVLILGIIPSVFANNLSVSNVVLGTRDPGTKTLAINFDVLWENSWRNKINHDAIWLTLRLNSSAVSPTNKKLCQISNSGLNPVGSTIHNNTALELYVPEDKNGLFLRRKTNGSIGNISSTNITATVKYDSCGFTDADQVNASVFGLEMVFIPEGSFFAGDNATSVASLTSGSGVNAPWFINSDNQISVNNIVSGGYRYNSNNNSGENNSGATFNIPSSFPKGYKSFYAMKYEITEGQWVEFVNSLPSDAMRARHDVTDNSHKNSDSVVKRNTIACSGSPLICSTTRFGRAVSFLSWGDLTAFLDWAALRPMTELEFEKISRGPVLPNNGEYAWGTTNITVATTISGSEDGTEIITNAQANANAASTVLIGGDANNGADNQQGALRSGIFATEQSTRESAGASYYGVMDLSGNLHERVVTIGNVAGLNFSGLNGDGNLSNVLGYEGNADVINWPGIDAIPSRGVTHANGSGFRGGSWADSVDTLRISDRRLAAYADFSARNDAGGRGVRSYDGN